MTDDADAAPLFKRVLLWVGAVLVFGASIAAFYLTMRWLRVHHGTMFQSLLLSLAYCALILTLSFVLAGRAIKYAGIRLSPAMSRYRRRMLAMGAVYCLTLVGAFYAFKALAPTGPLAFAIVLLPALSIAAMVCVMGLYLKEETDEFWRIQQTESALLAAGGMFIVTTAWGFLEMFKLVPHMQVWLVFPLWAVFLGPAALIVRRRYR